MVQLMKWDKRKHPTQSKVWIHNRYLIRYVKDRKSRLRFGCIGKKHFAKTPIVRHMKVISDKCIYDNDLIYWSERGRALGNKASSKSDVRQEAAHTNESDEVSPSLSIEMLLPNGAAISG